MVGMGVGSAVGRGVGSAVGSGVGGGDVGTLVGAGGSDVGVAMACGAVTQPEASRQTSMRRAAQVRDGWLTVAGGIYEAGNGRPVFRTGSGRNQL